MIQPVEVVSENPLLGTFLKTLPKARKVLELGFVDAGLARAYKTLHGPTHWTGVGETQICLSNVFGDVDDAVLMNVDDITIDLVGKSYDLVVFRNLLERLRDPQVLLREAHRLTAANGRMVCCIANAATLSLIHRSLLGDLSYDQNGAFGLSSTRLFSPSSAIKALLDAGWLPDLVWDRRTTSPELLESLMAAAQKLGVSADAFNRNTLITDMIFECIPISERINAKLAKRPTVSFVVPVTNPLQFELNIARSPGVAEMEAEIVQVRGAVSAADAYEQGRQQVSGEWIVYCHQDIYLPEGAGTAILSELALVDDARKREQIIGVIGLAALTPERLASGGTQFSGTIIDRISRLDYEPTDNAISIDESMIILHRDCVHAIDPDLGWHFWATDLVLSAMRRTQVPPCKVISVPVFHNSLTGWSFTDEFHSSLDKMFKKHTELDEIVSLCGTWQRAEKSP